MDTPPPTAAERRAQIWRAVLKAASETAASAPSMSGEDYDNWRSWNPKAHNPVRGVTHPHLPAKGPPPGIAPPTKAPPTAEPPGKAANMPLIRAPPAAESVPAANNAGSMPQTKAPPPVAARIPSAAAIPPPPKMHTSPPLSPPVEWRPPQWRPVEVEHPPEDPGIWSQNRPRPSSLSNSSEDDDRPPPMRNTWGPPKRLPAESARSGVSTQSAGSSSSAGSAPTGKAAPYIYMLPADLSEGLCGLCQRHVHAFRQPQPLGIQLGGLYLSCRDLRGMCCRNALIRRGIRAPAPLTVPPKPVATRSQLGSLPAAGSAHDDRPARGCYFP